MNTIKRLEYIKIFILLVIFISPKILLYKLINNLKILKNIIFFYWVLLELYIFFCRLFIEVYEDIRFLEEDNPLLLLPNKLVQVTIMSFYT